MLEQLAGQPGRAAGWGWGDAGASPAPHAPHRTPRPRSQPAAPEQRSRPREALLPGAPSPGSHTCPSLAPSPGPAAAPAGSSLSYGGAEGLLRGCRQCRAPRARGQSIPSCLAGRTSPPHPSQGSARSGLGPGSWSRTGTPRPGFGNGVPAGPRAGHAPRGPQGCRGQEPPVAPWPSAARGAGPRRGGRTAQERRAGGGTERLEVTLRVWAAVAQRSPA